MDFGMLQSGKRCRRPYGYWRVRANVEQELARVLSERSSRVGPASATAPLKQIELIQQGEHALVKAIYAHGGLETFAIAQGATM